jgi:hypothetical protein
MRVVGVALLVPLHLNHAEIPDEHRLCIPASSAPTPPYWSGVKGVMPKNTKRPPCPPWVELAVLVLSIAATAIEVYRRRHARNHGKHHTSKHQGTP